MQLDGLPEFIAVAQAGGFSAAAARLGVSPSAVSQTIRQLEQRLGMALFNRTTRSVSLTEAGARYLERVQPAVDELVSASMELGREASHPGGLLRLNVSRAGYQIVLRPLLARFLERYPDIRVEVRLSNGLEDIVEQGFDAGIRFGDLVEKDMIALNIGPPISAHVIASPSYLERHGMPAHPCELQQHTCIAYRHHGNGQVERWAFEKDGQQLDLAVPARLIVDDSQAMVQAALDGIGIAYMVNGAIESCLNDGRLARILADWSPPLPGLTLYYADRRRVPAKLRALIDFLREARQ